MQNPPMDSIISIKALNKIYASSFVALKDINLDIHLGEIFALLGPLMVPESVKIRLSFAELWPRVGDRLLLTVTLLIQIIARQDPVLVWYRKN